VKAICVALAFLFAWCAVTTTTVQIDWQTSINAR